MASAWVGWGRRVGYPAVALLALMSLGGAARAENTNVATVQHPTAERFGNRSPVVMPHIEPPAGLPTTVPTAGGPVADPDATGIPVTVLGAYQRAANSVAQTDPSCHLTWPVLAAIGKVESDHAENGDVDPQGDMLQPIYGPVLDGLSGTAAIPTAANSGQLPGAWARAEGPMQFLPGTWTKWGVAATGEGQPNVQNVNDSALAAGHYLCAGNLNLSDPGDLTTAILRYNPSLYYVDIVTYWLQTYDNGAATIPDTQGMFALADDSFQADPELSSANPQEAQVPPESSSPVPAPAQNGSPTQQPPAGNPAPSLPPAPAPAPAPLPIPLPLPLPDPVTPIVKPLLQPVTGLVNTVGSITKPTINHLLH